MATQRVISGNTEDEIWQQLNADLQKEPDLLQYNALLKLPNRNITLDIDIDLGGGFESGYATTILNAPFANPSGFRFALHREDLVDEIGKFFGMQDIEIGYPEFDSRILVKANNEVRVKEIFSDPASRLVFQQLPDFTFEIKLPDGDPVTEDSRLELFVEEGLTSPETLHMVYQAFSMVLNALENPAPSQNPVSL